MKMQIEQRLKRLAERKSTLPPAEIFKAKLAVFQMVHEREPTQEEIDELKAEAWEQMPEPLPQVIQDVEGIVYERKDQA